MEKMTDEERARLGHAVRQTRLERYPTKLAAYQDAGVNSATWDRIEKGESVKDHTLRQVIKRLWPSAGGDWQQVPGVRWGDLDYSVIGDTSSADYPLKVEHWISELQERVELLEKHVYDRTETPETVDPGRRHLAAVSEADDTMHLKAVASDAEIEPEAEAHQIDP